MLYKELTDIYHQAPSGREMPQTLPVGVRNKVN